MRRRGMFCLLVAVVLLAGRSVAAQEAHKHIESDDLASYIKWLEDPSRAEWQKPEEVVAKLDLKAGQTVVDVGAGSGYFTVRLARAVGPTGKVIAVDVLPGMIEYLDRRVKEEKLTNIQSVLAEPGDPKLPPASADLIFICNTLHHISDRPNYYPLLAKALKPGGRVVNVDFEKRPTPHGPPVEERIDKAEVVKEFEAAGFRRVGDQEFLKYHYFLVFGR